MIAIRTTGLSRPLRPTKNIGDGLRFPLAAPRRGDPTPIESGGDLAQRLRPCGLSLADHRHNGVGMRLGAGLETGMGDGAGLRELRTAQDLPTSLGGGESLVQDSGCGCAR